MKKLIYHGSIDVIRTPAYGKGSAANDYGRGFYCTEHVELAKEWACRRGIDGYANCYEIDDANMNVLRLNSDDYHILNWLAVLTKHRSYWQQSSISASAKTYLQEHFFVDVDKYDIVTGYRADDSYFSFAQDFVSGAISLRKLRQAMYLGELGEQIVLKSRRAFDALRYINAYPAPSDPYFGKKTERDKAARAQYREAMHPDDHMNDLFMLDIMREGIKNDDPRLR